MRFKSVAEFLDPTKGYHPTKAERDLIEAVQGGRDCWLCDRKNPTRPASATDQTRIRAELLRLLILGGTPNCDLQERGVTVIGGWIEGSLDLAYCSARGRTALRFCDFVESLEFGQTRFKYLDLSDSTFPGLSAQGLRVRGNLSLRRIVAKGSVSLAGGRIGGQFACMGASFSVGSGKALNCQRLEVGTSFLLRGATSTGPVHLNGAKIGGQLDCTDTRLHALDRNALYAPGISVGQDLYCIRMVATGTVILRGGIIGGQFSCIGATFDGGGGLALQAQRLTVAQGFHFRNVQRVNGRVDLTAAKIGALVDDSTGWPSGTDDLVLNGLTYDRLGRTAPMTLDGRSEWLALGSRWKGEFRPQPHTQLARVLREMGNSVEARKVLIERQRLQGIASRQAMTVAPNGDVSVAFISLWADARRTGHWFLDYLFRWVAGYGQDAARSLWWLAGLLVAATILAHYTWEEGSFAPNSDVILVSPGWAEATARDCLPVDPGVCDPNPAETWANTFTTSASPAQGADWDSFNRYGYALDLVVPFLDLGQTDAWAPSKDRGDWGWWLWCLRWVLATLGWIVTGLGVAAVTGVMQRNQPD